MSSSKTSGSDDSAVASPAERRRNLRFPFSGTVEAMEVTSGMNISGRVCDLGLGGCYIDTLNPFPVGTEAKLRITNGNETFEVRGKIVSSQMGIGMGVAFVSAQPGQVRLFQKWVLEASRKSAPLPDTEQTHGSPAEQLEFAHGAVLSELVLTLMKKNVLTEEEGKALLEKIIT